MKRKLIKAMIVCAAMMAGAANAASFEGAVAAYQRGDYASVLRTFADEADQGNAKAQYNLGLMYQKGQGIARDDDLSFKWLSLAAARGLEGAKNDRDIVAKEMTPAQIAKADRLISGWLKKFMKH